MSSGLPLVKERLMLRRVFQSFLRYAYKNYPNLIIDRLARPLDLQVIEAYLADCRFEMRRSSSAELAEWAATYYPDYSQRFAELRYKKILEFYITYDLLDPQPEHVFMDAAGGAAGYLAHLNTSRRILQDIRIADVTRMTIGSDVEYIECDAGTIPLPDKIVDRISCHHSFEHFQGNSDAAFICEVQRLLKVGGRCCIVPVFVANRYCEVTDRLSWKFQFDSRSRRVIDPTARIPGGSFSGHYARIYDLDAFTRRVLDQIDDTQFGLTISTWLLDDTPVPDQHLPSHREVTAVNFPYRALLIERVRE
jgi:hypothetical protein